eukprot:jgi/Botrbrau1/14141/Bobra.182_3s0082.1
MHLQLPSTSKDSSKCQRKGTLQPMGIEHSFTECTWSVRNLQNSKLPYFREVSGVSLQEKMCSPLLYKLILFLNKIRGNHNPHTPPHQQSRRI